MQTEKNLTSFGAGSTLEDKASTDQPSNPALKQQKVKKLLRAVEKLPSIPKVVNKTLAMLEDPRITAAKLSETISTDLALTGRILKMANSSYYGFPRKIKSIKEAIVILGFNTVKNLVTAASMQKIFTAELPGYRLQKGELWRHSIACGMCAETFAHLLNKQEIDPEEAFVAGLLHDMGKIILDHFLKDEYEMIMAKVIASDIPFVQAEQAILGFDHAEIGAMIAISWNLPMSTVQAIGNHHEPLKSKSSPGLAAVVKLGDAICLTFGMGIGGEDLDIEEETDLLSFLGIDKQYLSNMIHEVGETVSESALFLS